MPDTILTVSGLKTYFTIGGGLFSKRMTVRAVDDVSFAINAGETFGLVGESGCGKSTLGRTIMKIYPPTAGNICYKGQDVAGLRGPALKAYRRQAQMIFQDPYASLNPRNTVGEIIGEPMKIHNLYASPAEADRKVSELLETVGLKPDHIRRYPHEFSGGQRQRICIARALATNPQFIVCDEPISALDVSIQAQIINMLKDIQASRGIAYLFIAHDIGAVKHMSHRIGVMYLGSLLEVGGSDDIYHRPLHPYTQALIAAIPIPDPRSTKKNADELEGELPSPLDKPDGCAFRTRCPHAMDRCAKQVPALHAVDGRQVACFLYE